MGDVAILMRRGIHLVFLLPALCLPQLLAAAPCNAPAVQKDQRPVTAATFMLPFAPDSLWKLRPVNPVFDDFVIPKSRYVPTVAEGAYSTGVFWSKPDDPGIVVNGADGAGVWDPDALEKRTIRIPRWPAAVRPASGTDGHADVVDPVTGVIHSFWQLKKIDDRWVASQYAWSCLSGRGWGDPAHYFQGARAAGVPSLAGLIRRHELNDGLPAFRHALAMSLTYDGLSPAPAYVYPATSADTGAMQQNTGAIPQGALVMLPPSFDAESIGHPILRKVARTLKLYGAYVVDRNEGTPYAIYVENGAGFDLHGGGWNNAVAADLDRIRAGLRGVVSQAHWQDGTGKTVVPSRPMNVLSMRGPWLSSDGIAIPAFDTWEQAVVFAPTAKRIVLVNKASQGLTPVTWAHVKPGSTMRLIARTSGGGRFRLAVRAASGDLLFDSGPLANAESVDFVWPAEPTQLALEAASGIGGASTVAAELVRVAGPGRNVGPPRYADRPHAQRTDTLWRAR